VVILVLSAQMISRVEVIGTGGVGMGGVGEDVGEGEGTGMGVRGGG